MTVILGPKIAIAVKLTKRTVPAERMLVVKPKPSTNIVTLKSPKTSPEPMMSDSIPNSSAVSENEPVSHLP